MASLLLNIILFISITQHKKIKGFKVLFVTYSIIQNNQEMYVRIQKEHETKELEGGRTKGARKKRSIQDIVCFSFAFEYRINKRSTIYNIKKCMAACNN